MLEFRGLLTTGWVTATAVRCAGGHAPEEPVTTPAVVLVRRGVFVRHADGRATLADVTTGYIQRPGETQRISHPHGGDVCTALTVTPELADRLARTGPLPSSSRASFGTSSRVSFRASFRAGLLHVSAPADLIHRRLLAAPPVDRPDLAGELLAALLPAPHTTRPAHPVVEEVRELLHLDPTLDLTALAGVVSWSPWHLSRAFHQATGSTLSTYRRRLRVRAALDDLLTEPRASLATVAARTGFADQPHMTRAIRTETGSPPATLRRLLYRSRPGNDLRAP
ncbi:helix-turn-helix domain-containing protein [Actinoplanes sp. HUAS TT8]|uniref:helix-turn-helix domain-containing protein n=1 Tax=Actinoplanes sp. HUAS TT8 TaxID=3447453 RepID=UPI003F527E5F